jgi:Leucine-rich repeat (LRR) protein
VVDNLRADDFYFLETLPTTLLAGTQGSKVLITTQDEKVCRIMHSVSRPNLAGLNDDECWQLLEALAIPEAINIIDRYRFVTLGKEIAKRCHGSPLAAKVLGTLLRGATEEQWSDVLLEMRALRNDQNRMLATLKISYRHLSYPLKQCFAYCSIFPYGYKFERDQIIRYWTAEGLMQLERWQLPEFVGMEYLDELVWRSFFEKVPVCDKSRVERYTMPRLMHDLARSVSKYEFRGLESDSVLGQSEVDHHEQARYASLLQQENKPPVNLECIEQYPNLRTLKLCDEWGERIVLLNPIKEQSLLNSVNLRVLDLSNSNLKFVPDSIAELIHLRYLGLSNTEIRTLPEKICILFNLQTLDLKGCLKLEGLPEGMHKLFNLKHLDLHLDWEEITDSTDIVIPPGIGELKRIETFSRFSVASDAKTEDCNIFELKDLKISGELCISNIERVPVHKPEAALNANLQKKTLLKNLMLRWNGSAQSAPVQWDHSKKVMQYLEPNNGLESLWLINYPGTRFPDWIGHTSFLRLETIRISNCNNFTFLPLLGQLPWLKNLQIDNIPARTMDTVVGFPSLEHFTLLNLQFLERLCLENDIPKLENVCVSDCPDLKELVIHQNLHRKFERANCPNLSVIIHVP